MKFTYAYKTSDGKRHEAEMEASSREDVFQALRQRGIKPIKVIAEDGSRANGEARPRIRRRVIVLVAVLMLICGGILGMLLRGPDNSTEPHVFSTQKYTSVEKQLFVDLTGRADAIMERHQKQVEKNDLAALVDGNSIFATNDVSHLYRIAKRGESGIEEARKALRVAFSKVGTEFPSDGAALKDVQRIYGHLMDTLDAEEVALSNRKFALALLDSNRGKWSLKDGKPEFSDKRLAQMFRYCMESIDIDSSTVRWNKDFNVSTERQK